MRKISTNTILKTVEYLRLKRYSDLSEELVSQIVELEAQHINSETNRSEIARQIEKVVDLFLDEGGQH
jgi:hypothetical protein